jgi:signal transduction histidine kinase
VALRVDGANDVVGVCNRTLLLSWLKLEDFEPGNNVALGQVLEVLFDAPVAQRILLQVDALRATADPTPLGELMPARTERLAPRQRCFKLAIHPLASEMERQIVLLLSDASEHRELTLALEDARATRDLALSALRTDAAAMRTLRESGASAVATIRSTLRLPARSQEALREKLTRMQHEADALGGQAQVLSLTALVLACEALTRTLVALRQKEVLSGDELLPLAPRIDAVAVALGDLQRIDEQRAAAPLPPVSSIARRGIAPGVPWHEASESRWRTYVHQTGDALGVLARLKMSGAEIVPARHRRHVDAILQPLLDNALQHGIEDLERRLKADKAAAGQITVTFRELGAEGIEMTVHDDGAGFDVERIGRAAIASGLLTEATLGRRNEASLVGLIFRPTFTTEGLPGNQGRGRGIAAVRKTVSRLGGKIGVATKRRRYTLFTIRLPAPAGATAHVLHSARAAP